MERKSLSEAISKFEINEKVGPNTIMSVGVRFQGEVDGDVVKLRILQPVGKYAQIVSMDKEGTGVGMIPTSDMLFKNIEWTKKEFKKIKNVMLN